MVLPPLFAYNREMKHILTFFVLGMMSFWSIAQAETTALPVVAQSDVQVQQTVEVADLGIENTGTLPTSAFYFFKEWKRGVERLFTRSAIKKTELEIRISNEKLAEALAIEKERPNDAKAFHEALKNYQSAELKIQDQLSLMNADSESPEAKDMLVRLDKQSLLHAELLVQVEERWSQDPYAEDATRRSGGDPDFDLVARTIKETQVVRVDSWAAVVERQAGGKQTAEVELERAQSEINLLKTEVAKFFLVYGAEINAIAIREQGVRKAEIAIDEPGVHRVD